MPMFSFTKSDTAENTIDELIKRMAWLTSRLDSQNVKRLDTNETVIKSADGTTEIVGPVLVQKDSSGTTRLSQGYNSTSTDFEYKLYNESGVLTVDIDSNGDLVVERGLFKGSITIGTGNNVFKADTNGMYLGNALYASAPFKVSMTGAAIATNLVITGGSISVATDATIGSTLTMQSDSLDGIYFKDNSGGTVFGEFSITRGVGDAMVLNNNFNPINITSLDSAYIKGGSTSATFDTSASFKYLSSDRITYGSGGGTLSGTWYYGSYEIADKNWVASQGYITGTSGTTAVIDLTTATSLTVVNGLIAGYT